MKIRSMGGPTYQLKVTLWGSNPPIWRRFLVPSDITLKHLHHALQMVMGWSDSHMHQFSAGGVFYGTPNHEFGAQTVSESKTKLDKVLRNPNDRIAYEYDFGDSWEHEIELEQILPHTRGARYPWILAGERACPPDDVGGIPGYYHFLEALADPKHPEHEDIVDWIGGKFDPDKFDVKKVNLSIHGGWAPNESEG